MRTILAALFIVALAVPAGAEEKVPTCKFWNELTEREKSLYALGVFAGMVLWISTEAALTTDQSKKDAWNRVARSGTALDLMSGIILRCGIEPSANLTIVANWAMVAVARKYGAPVPAPHN